MLSLLGWPKITSQKIHSAKSYSPFWAISMVVLSFYVIFLALAQAIDRRSLVTDGNRGIPHEGQVAPFTKRQASKNPVRNG